ncbi:MAG TPA: VCBS repeat-containing protein [Polyangia bacterium]|nr:VCBS repeat-containing protein [Polyangia bacterium]
MRVCRAGRVVSLAVWAAALNGGCRSESRSLQPARGADGGLSPVQAAPDGGARARPDGANTSPSVDAATATRPPAARHDAAASARVDAGADVGTTTPATDGGQRPDPCAVQPDAGAPPPPYVCVAPTVARRMLFPLSGLTVTSSRPQLSWTAADAGPTAIEICSERTCAQPLLADSAAGTSFTPATDIPPGYWFWRIRAQAGDAAWTAPWLFRVRRRSPDYRSIANTAAEPFSDYDGDGVPDAPGGTDFDGDGYSDDGGDVVPVNAACPRDDQKLSNIRFGSPTGLRDGPLFAIDGWDPLWISGPFGIGDLDGDGYGEMIGLKRYGGYLLHGCGAPPPAGVAPLVDRFPVNCGSCQTSSAQAGDFDGDRLTDMLYASNDGVTIVFGSAGATRAPAFIRILPPVWVVDYNGDGYSDFLAEDYTTLTIAIRGWLGGPDGPTPDPAPPALLSSSAGGFDFGDFDGDGTWDRIDASGVTYGGAQGRTAPTPRFTTGADPTEVLDVNGDDFDDVRIAGTWYFGSPQGLPAVPARP